MSSTSNACNCIGPQSGQPVCPCQMKDVKIIGGRYILQQDLGPVSVDEYIYSGKEKYTLLKDDK